MSAITALPKPELATVPTRAQAVMMAYDGTRFCWERLPARSPHVCFGEVLYEPGGSCGPRVQRDYQLLFLHSGTVLMMVDAVSRCLEVGSVALLLPGRREHFRFSAAMQTHHSWCVAAPGLFSPKMRHDLAQVAHTIPCPPSLQHLLAAGLALENIRGHASMIALQDLGVTLFATYVHEAVNHGQAHSQPLLKALHHFQENHANRDCLQTAHHIAGVSRNTLINHFKRELKTTPGHYLWRLRTERGIERLAQTGHSIAEIAYSCGFQDSFHFSRRVKQIQGVSPRELRTRIWNAAAVRGQSTRGKKVTRPKKPLAGSASEPVL